MQHAYVYTSVSVHVCDHVVGSVLPAGSGRIVTQIVLWVTFGCICSRPDKPRRRGTLLSKEYLTHHSPTPRTHLHSVISRRGFVAFLSLARVNKRCVVRNDKQAVHVRVNTSIHKSRREPRKLNGLSGVAWSRGRGRGSSRIEAGCSRHYSYIEHACFQLTQR